MKEVNNGINSDKKNKVSNRNEGENQSRTVQYELIVFDCI